MRIVDASSLRPSEQGVHRPDKRTGLEMQVVRQNMSGINVKIRWVPHARMVVDGLTKKSANLEALYDLMDTTRSFRKPTLFGRNVKKEMSVDTIRYNKRNSGSCDVCV